ncbi:MAG: DUF2849 domain-containing protein [Alphaproteobacteria bacterium]|nr:MAG: DUF2849 domain-containing protein [Alphaproteobacteria bacterium]
MTEDDGEVFKVITANRLDDGAIVYFRLDDAVGDWVPDLKNATPFGEAEFADALEKARAFERDCVVLGVYEMEVTGRNRPLSARERIRARGPSIRYGKAATEPDFSI